jgi:hypothetical protein
MKEKITSDYDSGWKEVIEGYFEEFFLFYFPHIHKDIDFSKPVVFLDKEFSKIVKESKEKKRRADKLVKVYLKNGNEQWLLIHIEIQGSAEKDFSQRIYVHNYRIFDKHKKEVITLVILTDESDQYMPDKYEIKRWGFHLLCKYPLIKLIDYREKITLHEAKNPFEIITFAHLKNLETKKDYNQRLFWKITLVKKLYEKGYTKEDILKFYRFIDWVMSLPKDLSIKFNDEILNFEEGLKMPYITTAERIGMEKGFKQGLVKEAQKMVIEAIKEKFGVFNSEIEQLIKDISSEEDLMHLFRMSFRLNNFEDFKEELRRALENQ